MNDKYQKLQMDYIALSKRYNDLLFCCAALRSLNNENWDELYKEHPELNDVIGIG